MDGTDSEIEVEVERRFRSASTFLNGLPAGPFEEQAHLLGSVDGQALMALDLVTRMPETKYRADMMIRGAASAAAIHAEVLRQAIDGGVSEVELRRETINYVMGVEDQIAQWEQGKWERGQSPTPTEPMMTVDDRLLQLERLRRQMG